MSRLDKLRASLDITPKDASWGVSEEPLFPGTVCPVSGAEVLRQVAGTETGAATLAQIQRAKLGARGEPLSPILLGADTRTANANLRLWVIRQIEDMNPVWGRAVREAWKRRRHGDLDYK